MLIAAAPGSQLSAVSCEPGPHYSMGDLSESCLLVHLSLTEQEDWRTDGDCCSRGPQLSARNIHSTLSLVRYTLVYCVYFS